MTDWLLRLARFIAGRDRTDWSDAMAAEAAAAGPQRTSWALGCLAASLRDRLARERKFMLTIVLLPVAAMIFTAIWFFAVAWLWHHAGLPSFGYSALMAAAPLPLAYYLGTIRPREVVMLAAVLCFVIYHSIPMIVTWMQFGTPYIGSTSIYGLPFLLGYALGLSVWLAGAWLGSRRNAARG